MAIQTVNPVTEKIINTYITYSKSQISACIDAAELSFRVWRTTEFEQRSARMLVLADLLKKQQHELAELMALEMGKPVSAGIDEIKKCVWVCRHFADHAQDYLAPRQIDTEMGKTKVCYQPLGIIFAIMPWNFPFWQVFRFAAPTIMAGNAAILKHASICTGTGMKIAELFLEAGFPDHLFQHFILDNDLAADVIAHNKIRAVTLTGSDNAGRIVGAQAASHLKKTVMELGGNDPYIVLEDADIDLAARCIVESRMKNTGQVCIAAKRVIVVPEAQDELLKKIIENISQYSMGDPLDATTNFGPMARQDLRQTLHKQVVKSKEKGAEILLGGVIPNGKGFYYPPTVLSGVKPGMPAFDDELFGPVIAMITANNENHAIKLANQSRYGLGAAVFTRDLERGEHIATQDIEVGSCFVNEFVSSDPRIPFGGIKQSGFGRELSREGILEFVNVKTVRII